MIRILLPLAVIAALLLPPIFAGPSAEVAGIVKPTTVTGYDYVGNTIDCWMDRNFILSGDCEPEGGIRGKAIFGAVFISAVAAALGVLGLLPVIGRLTSFITMLAGVVVIAAIGYFALTMMGTDEGLAGVQWGSYLAGGGGLLTLISGLAGARGR